MFISREQIEGGDPLPMGIPMGGSHLDSLGFTWTHMDSLGLTWTHLDSLSLTCSHLVSLGLTGTHLDSREKGKLPGAKREKGKGMQMIFEIHSDLVYSCARTHERNETTSRLVSLPPTSDMNWRHRHMSIAISLTICLRLRCELNAATHV